MRDGYRNRKRVREGGTWERRGKGRDKKEEVAGGK